MLFGRCCCCCSGSLFGEEKWKKTKTINKNLVMEFHNKPRWRPSQRFRVKILNIHNKIKNIGILCSGGVEPFFSALDSIILNTLNSKQKHKNLLIIKIHLLCIVPASVCAYGSGIFTLISLKFKTHFTWSSMNKVLYWMR